ncbi:N-acetylmuramoyl-L-alanine amidase [Terribacillus saccharophilus]|uniref:N-acetylmuramoyl-L-alanine amidase n=1 Tax=Terribacillus saccharophilus TaxID=361277 RepID=UPI000C9A764B|nr:N-acetylmuramoyl-L-alanine amidase [Terribacillus goriensis]
MVKKVAADAGHAGFGVTAGKCTPDGEYEWNFNNAVIVAMTAKLKANGVEVLRTDDPTGKTDVPLEDRVAKANKWGADVFVSSHHNANKGVWENHTGTETYIVPNTTDRTKQLAQNVHSKLVEAMGLRDRGIKTANFYVIKYTKMPAVLMEGGYMDSKIDIKKLRDSKVLKNAGEAVAEGILAFLGMSSGKKAAATPTPTISKPDKYNGSVVDYLKSKGIDSSMAYRKKLAASYGISGYEGSATQNVELLNKLQSGSTVNGNKPKVQRFPAAKSGEGIVDYLKRIGVDSSFDNREDLAEEYGISGYTGSASQNTLLLSKLNGSGESSGSKLKAKSIDQMAKEVIQGKHGSGHENRHKSLGISTSQYTKVRARVNQMM